MSSTDESDFTPLRGVVRQTKMSAAEAAVYRRIVDSTPLGWLTTADEFAVAELARVTVQLEHVNARMAVLANPIIHTSHGDAPHPLVTHQDRLRRRMTTLRTELRLTPAARAKKLPTKLGRERAETDASANAISARPNSLMFGGRRAAEALGLAANDDED